MKKPGLISTCSQLNRQRDLGKTKTEVQEAEKEKDDRRDRGTYRQRGRESEEGRERRKESWRQRERDIK